MTESRREPGMAARPKVLLFANTEWYLFNFRLPLAKAARAQGADVVLVAPPGPYAQKLVGEGFRFIPFAMSRRSLNPWREAQVLVALWRLYRREQPDLVHHFTVKCVVYGGLAARAAGIASVVSAVTGMGYVFSSRDWLARLLRPVVRGMLHLAMGGRGSRLIVQNPDDRRAALDGRFIRDAYVRLIESSGVDTERFKPRGHVAAEAGRPFTVVFAARLLRDKGLHELLAAARRLRSEGLPVRFVVAGDPDPGNPASVDEDELAALRAEGAATFLGHVQDMAALFATADAVALPTCYSEGVPRSLIEAAAAGLPIVTTDAPGCREAVEHGHNGFLVPARDACALADALRTLVQDPALARRMGAAGRAKALAQFDERTVLAKTLAVYRELLPAWPEGRSERMAASPDARSDALPAWPEARANATF